MVLHQIAEPPFPFRCLCVCIEILPSVVERGIRGREEREIPRGHSIERLGKPLQEINTCAHI